MILNHWFSKCGLLAHQLHCVTVTGIKVLYTNVSHVGISDIRNKKTEQSSQSLKSYHVDGRGGGSMILQGQCVVNRWLVF